MNYKHNILLRILTERSIASFIGILIVAVYLALPFFPGFVVGLVIIGGFFILITSTEQPGLLTNIVVFFFVLTVLIGTGYKIVSYEPYFKQGNIDLNQSYVYSEGETGHYNIQILDGHKIKYSFTVTDETILLKETLDINITETDSWWDQIGDTNYKIMN